MFKSKTLIKIGFELSELLTSTGRMIDQILETYRVRYSICLMNDDKKNNDDLSNPTCEIIIDYIDKVNERIIHINKDLNKLPYFKYLKPVKINKNTLKSNFKYYYGVEIHAVRDVKEVKYEKKRMEFRHYLNTLFLPLILYIKKIFETISDENDKFEIKNINKVHLSDLQEVIDLYSLSYRRTALLALGRIFEEVINNYFKFLIKRKQIMFSMQELSNPKFNSSEIGYSSQLDRLKKQKFLTEHDYLLLTKIRLDRNIGAHPCLLSSKKISENECEQTIKLGINILKRIDKKISKLSLKHK